MKNSLSKFWGAHASRVSVAGVLAATSPLRSSAGSSHQHANKDQRASNNGITRVPTRENGPLTRPTPKNKKIAMNTSFCPKPRLFPPIRGYQGHHWFTKKHTQMPANTRKHTSHTQETREHTRKNTRIHGLTHENTRKKYSSGEQARPARQRSSPGENLSLFQRQSEALSVLRPRSSILIFPLAHPGVEFTQNVIPSGFAGPEGIHQDHSGWKSLAVCVRKQLTCSEPERLPKRASWCRRRQSRRCLAEPR